MALAEVIAEMRADLTEAAVLPVGGEPIPDQPPDVINAYPMIVLFPKPNVFAIQRSNNATGQSTYGGDHDIVIIWITNRPTIAQAIEEATPIADSIPRALFNGFRRDRFGGTVHHLNSVTCSEFGPSAFDSTEAFSVKFLANVTVIEITDV